MDDSSTFRRCLISCFVAVISVSAGRAGSRLEEFLAMRRLVGEEKFVEAIARCKQLIERYPDYIALYESLPEIATYARSLDESQLYFEQRIGYGSEIALSYFGLGENYYAREDFENAFRFYSKAISLGLTAPDCFRRYEYAYEKCWGVDGSIHYFGALCRQNPNNANYWYAASLALFSKSQYSKAKESIEEAVRIEPFEPEYGELRSAISASLQKKLEGGQSLSRLSALAMERGDFQSGFFLSSYLFDYRSSGRNISKYRTAVVQMVSDANMYGTFRWRSFGLIRLGYDLMYSALYDSALKVYLSAERTAEIAADRACIASAISGQVDVALEIGNYTNAIDGAIRLLRASEANGLEEYRIPALVSLARACHEMGVDEAALPLISEALENYELSGSERGIAVGLYSELGQIYLSQGHLGHGSRCFEKATIRAAHAGTWIDACMSGNMGIFLARTGKTELALQQFLSQKRKSLESKFSREEAYGLAYLGDCSQMLHRNSSARSFYEQAETLASSLELDPVVLLCTRGREQMAIRDCDTATALQNAKKAFQIAESSESIDMARGIGPISNESFRNDFENVVEILIRRNQGIEALDYYNRYCVQQLKSFLRLRVLGDVLRRSMLVNPEEKGVRKSEESQLGKKAFGRDQEILESSTPTIFHRSDQVRSSTIRQTQAMLSSRRAALLGVIVAEEHTFVFLIKADTVLHLVVTQGRAQLSQILSKISPILTVGTSKPNIINSALANFNIRATEDLYRLLIQPIEGFLNDIENLIIVPDGILNRLPFEMILCGEDSTIANGLETRLLLNKFQISYAFSPSFLFWQRQYTYEPSNFILAVVNPSRTPEPSTATGFGSRRVGDLHDNSSLPVLPGAEQEVRWIFKLLDHNGEIVTGSETPKIFLGNEGLAYRIIHIAAHATFDDKLPWLSSISFSSSKSAGNTDDLRLSDLTNLRLNCELAVLSGCNTGRGFGIGGSRGFASAFQCAGAASVVASLWNVDDETTAEFMRGFYGYLVQGKSKSRALRMAKLDLVRAGRTDPFFWAPFVLIGDTGPLKDNPARHQMAPLMALGGLLIFIAYFCWWRGKGRTWRARRSSQQGTN